QLQKEKQLLKDEPLQKEKQLKDDKNVKKLTIVI
ncbi:hypothetical protein BG20_I2469, partial [Candidatus Nitrosarchaeum limnium BG20]